MINLPRSMISVALMLAAVSAPAASHDQTTHSFVLPAQSLSDSLRQLGSQTGLNVIFDPAAVNGRMAPNVNCDCDAKQALGRLLDRTGFTAEFTNATTVVIKPLSKPPGAAKRIPPHSSADARVEQRRERAAVTSLPKVTVLGSLIPRSRIETSSQVIIISAQTIKERGFSSVADALQNASVNTGAVNNTASTQALRNISSTGGRWHCIQRSPKPKRPISSTQI